MSITELATLRAKPDAGDDLAKALPDALAVITTDPECLGATALRCIERPDEFVVRVEWTSVRAHEEFRTAPVFSAYRATISDHLGEVVGFAHYDGI